VRRCALRSCRSVEQRAYPIKILDSLTDPRSTGSPAIVSPAVRVVVSAIVTLTPHIRRADASITLSRQRQARQAGRFAATANRHGPASAAEG